MTWELLAQNKAPSTQAKDIEADPSPVADSSGTDPSVQPEITSSDIPDWNCRVEGSPKEEAWTVGEIFNLHCEGPTAKFLSTELAFKSKKKGDVDSGYRLHILEVIKQTDNSLDMKMTSYIPANYNFDKLAITDQKVEVVTVAPFALNVKTVITNPQQKPFGPIMALKMQYPMWLWVSLVLVAVVSVFFGLFRMNRRNQMRKVIEELKQHNTALGAFNQFNKDVRT